MGNTSSTTKDSDSWGIGEFCLGCIMIPFAIVFLWKNEKKLVTYAKCMETAEKYCQMLDPNTPHQNHNFDLVHMSGKSENKTDLVDNDFGVTAENSYRLKRTVEMYQWTETRTPGSDGQPDRYSYHQGWHGSAVDSSSFHESGHENPKVTWPFQSNTIEAQHVTLGMYKLNASQVSRLGSSNGKTADVDDGMVEATEGAMGDAGFSAFQCRGNYLVASTDDNGNVGEHVGQYRVCFSYDTCGTTTVMAQQIQDDEEVFTFRKWNPEKLNVPLHESTDADGDETCGNPLCCYICMCVNCIFNTAFEEVVDSAVDYQNTAAAYFEAQKAVVSTAAKCFRPLGIVLTIWGNYMLFAPVIKLLKWIPLVGWLLGGIVALAAAIFAFVVGGTVSCLVIAIAWVFFRPLVGVPLLLATGAGIYFIFFYDWDTAAVVDETTDDGTATGGDTINPDTTGGGGVQTN
jgi:hypothetical protein